MPLPYNNVSGESPEQIMEPRMPSPFHRKTGAAASPGLHATILCLLLLCWALFSTSPAALGQTPRPTTIRVGVLAHRGATTAMAQWTPTAHYLNSAVPGHTFAIIPLDFRQVREAVKEGSIDFLITNSGYYVELEHDFGIRRIATKKNLINHSSSTLFGGVIFTRAGRREINTLKDLAGKSFVAVDENSFGGWKFAWRELQEQGIEPERDLKALTFAGTHDAVVLAVLSGRNDAGTVRTDTLERMVEEGALDLATLKVLNGQPKAEHFSYLRSTRLYPEWPFASLKHTPEALAEDVAVALLRMPQNSRAATAARIAGWTVPLDYQPVHDLLKDLRLPPYERGRITLADIVRQHWPTLLVACISILLLLIGAAYILRLNRKLTGSRARLATQLTRLQQTEEELNNHKLHLEKLVELRTAELSRSEANLAQAQRIARLGSWEWLIPQDQLWWSAEVYRIFGREPGEAPPDLASFLEVVHPEDRKAVAEAIQEALEQGRPYSVDHRLLLAGNTVRFIHGQAEVFRDADQSPLKLVGTVQDITAWETAKQEREELLAQLSQAQKLEAIGTLAGGIAHDFNNILAVMLGYTELALLHVPLEDEKQRHNLTEVLTAGKRARDLVSRILLFSRKEQIIRQPVDVAPIVQESLQMLRSLTPRNIEFRQQISASHGKIMADPTQIHQVLMNLCTNASHAMREQGGILTVSLDEETIITPRPTQDAVLAPGLYLRLSVEDTGPGLSSQVRQKMFDPFFTTKKKGEGTGMGLAVVHGIVKSCSGEILVRSTPGTGAAFDLYFPLLSETAGEENSDAPAPLSRGNERILFVDDEPHIAELGTLLLEGLGYQVTSLTSGGEALALFQKDPQAFDLVITDQSMPQMTGCQLSEKLRALRADIPVILCTGYSSVIAADTARAKGINAFMYKPCDREMLARKIRSLLDNKESTAPEAVQ